MAATKYLFTSESVTEGHPDKVCDQIPMLFWTNTGTRSHSEVACETAISTGLV